MLIEGFGGWLAPVAMQGTQTLWQADIARALDAQIILVVGMRLGCLNHSMLSVNQIQREGFTIKGWVANILDPNMDYLAENIATLEQQLDCPRIDQSHFDI